MNSIILVVVIVLVVFYLIKSAKNKKIAQGHITAGHAFLMTNKTQADITETTSGLQYQVLKKGTGSRHPSASSTVQVHYHGTLLDGTVFDSSVERKQPISFPLNQVIKGWTEGVQLMNEGDQFKFFIPSHLAYGNSAAGKIPPGSVLIFEVELLAIQ